MSKDVLIEVTIYDDESGEVSDRVIVNYRGEYGFEITRTFEQLGERIARKVDPSHDR
mgnify:CR=1 FL=1